MGERLPGQKSFVCSFFDCKAKFSKSWKLEAHLCKHTGLVSGAGRPRTSVPLVREPPCVSLPPQKPFSCESCQRSFCTRYQLTRHELNHSGEKPHKYERENVVVMFLQPVSRTCVPSGAPSTAARRPSSPTAA